LALSLSACSDDDAGGGNANNGQDIVDTGQDAHQDASDTGSDQDTADQDTADQDTAGQDTAGQDTAGQDTADADPAPLGALSLNLFSIDGDPIDAASITVVQTGDADASPSTKQTDASGWASFESLAAGRTLAMVEADGFAPATAVIDLPAGTQATRSIHLIATGEPHSFDPTTDSELYEDRVHVTIPANSLQDANGDDYTGAAQALITPLNPSNHNERAGMPGPLEGVLEGDSDATPMKSVFMADIQLQTDTGETLTIKNGAQATLEFVIPDDLQDDYSVGDQIEAYWYDTDQGMWIQEGKGDVIESTYAADRLAWTVDVNHFTWWNCDEPWYDKECVQVTVTNQDTGAPVEGAQVYVNGVTYNGTSFGTTDANGFTCVDFKLGETASVSVSGANGLTQVGNNVEITGTGTAATCAGQGEGACQRVEIELSPPSCVSGSVVDANGAPIAGANVVSYFAGAYTNESESTTTGANGEFCLSVPHGAVVDIVVSYVDANGTYMSTSTTLTAANDSLACGEDDCTDAGTLTPKASDEGCVRGEISVALGGSNTRPVAPGTHVYIFEGYRGDMPGSGDYYMDCTKPPEEWGTLLGETTTNADGTYCVSAPTAVPQMSVVMGKCGDATLAEQCLTVSSGVSIGQAGTCGDGTCTEVDIHTRTTCGEGP
jgi:hypothetical protein